MFTVTEKLRFIKRIFGSAVLSRDERNIAVKCPYCKKNDDKKKLVIRVLDDYMHCWRCGYRSSNLLRSLVHIGATDLKDEYCEKFMVGYEKANKCISDAPEALSVILPYDFKLLAIDNSKNAEQARVYLRQRGLNYADLWYYKFGTSCTDAFKGYIIFPSFDAAGKLNYFSARDFTGHTTIYRQKYKNANFPKKEIIFNEHNIVWSNELTIVEGPFDLVKCNTNAAAILGSEFVESHALFARILEHKTPVLLALDIDKQKKQEQIAKLLDSYKIPVRILSLGSFNDVGEMTHEQFLAARDNARQWSRLNSLKALIHAL